MSATFFPATDPQRPYLKARVKGGTYYVTRKPKPYSLGTKDLKEAQAEYDRTIGKERPTRGDIRCQEAWDAWIVSHKLRPNSRSNYQSAWDLYCKHIIGGELVSKVTVEQIIRILTEAANGISAKTGKPVGESRQTGIYVALSAFFTSMTKEPTRYRDDSPVKKIGHHKPDSPISKAVKPDEVLSLEQVDALVAACVPPTQRWRDILFAKQMALLIYILAFGGMRIGEALGLMLTDLIEDGNFGEWRIEKQVTRRTRRDKAVPNPENENPNTWHGPLKNEEGEVGDRLRFVPIMTAEVRRRVDAYIAEGLEGGWLKPGGLLFPTTTGKPRLVSGVDERFKPIREAVGLTKAQGRRKDTVIHHFRHTFASWLLESGAYSVEEIAGLIGDTIKTTVDRYAHLANRTFRNAKAVNAMAVRHGLQPEPVADNVIQFPSTAGGHSVKVAEA